MIKNTLMMLILGAAVLTGTAGPAHAVLSEPDVVYYGKAINASPGGIVTIALASSPEPLASGIVDADLKYVLRVPMDSFDPRKTGTARAGDGASLFVDGVLANGTIVIPARGTRVKLDLGVQDAAQWAKDHPNDDGSGDMNRNGISDLSEYLDGKDPAGCVWTQVDDSHGETTVYHPLVLKNCLLDAGADQKHNLIQVARGSYTGNFSYTSAWGEAYDLTLIGGYDPAGAGERLADPSLTVLSSDTDIDGISKGAVLVVDDTYKTFGTVHIESLSFKNGKAPAGQNGGGIQARIYQGGLELVGNSISNNTADSGGGVSVESSDSGAIFLANNIIYSNSAGNAAAVRVVSAATGTVVLLNNTVADNTATADGDGSSLLIESANAAVDMTNNIVSSATGSDIYVDSSGNAIPLTITHNDFALPGGLLVNAPCFVLDGTNIGGEPLFVSPGEGNYRLNPGSPCIDTGRVHAYLPAKDADGAGRVLDSGVDMGAYEYHVSAVTATPSAGAHGSISPDTPQLVSYGTATVFIVTPEPGYSIASVTGCNGTRIDSTYTTEALITDCTVTALFADITPPNVPIVSGVSPVNNTRPTWTWTSGGGGNGTYRYQLDSETGTWTTDTSLSYMPATSLSAGSHTLYVQETDDAGNWSLSGGAAIVIDTTAPNQPVVAGITPTNNGRPTWTWISGGEGNGTYRRQLDGETGVWITVTSLSYRPATSLSVGSHILYVQEKDEAGNWSASGSHTIEIVPELTAPNAPTDLAGVWTEGAGVALTWTDNAADEAGYYVYRKLSTDAAWSKIGETSAAAYTDAAAATDMSWQYYVAAYNGAGSARSNIVKVLTGTLTAPDKLKSTVTGTGVDLAWHDTSALEDGFTVYRKTLETTVWTNQTFTPLSADSTSYSDDTAASGVLYSYQVCAMTSAGGQACSGAAEVNGPGGLLATFQTGAGVALTWTDNSVDEAGFRIYRKTNTDAAFTKVGEAGPDAVGYIDGTVALDRTYTYYVAAYNSAMAAGGEKVNVLTGDLLAPTRINATMSGSSVSLTWKDTNTSEDGYEVWRRSADAGNWTRIVALGAGSTACTDMTSASGVLYKYQVCAVTSAGGQMCGGAVGVNGPGNFSANFNSGTGTIMTWTDNSSDETTFVPMRRDNSGSTWVKLPAAAADATTATDAYFTPGSYSYKVCATNSIASNCSTTQVVTVE